jgi:tetratricopeptide (TPR) repeat protein
MLLLIGCAGQYEMVEEPTQVEAKPQWTTAQIDSIIRYNRMFFFDYYQQMNRKGEFNAQGIQQALNYFWNYIEYDTARKYNDFPQSAHCYIEWTKIDPTKADSARIVYEMGVERFPDSDYLHNALGIIYKNRSDFAIAESHFLKASAVNSKNPDYLIPLTEIYQQQAEWEKCKDVCEKVLAIDPANSTIRDRLETVLRDHFTPAEYIEALKKKIEVEPTNISNYLKLAQQYLNQGNNMEAQKTVLEALKLDAKNIEALAILGDVKQNLQDYNGAIEAYKKILSVTPDDKINLLEISICFKSLKDYATARSYVLKVLKLEPGNGSAFMRFGEIYETAADNASRNKQANYSDKLAFTIAYGLFEKAANSDDYTVKDNAQRKLKYMEENLVPQKSDWFMKQNQFVPTGEAYRWIDENWDEVRYIKSFLKRYSG